MSKYLEVFKISWQQGITYRLNFALWRVRSVIQLLLVYFIWWTIFQNQSQVFGYTQSTILTYVLLTAVLRAIVLSSRTTDLMNQINEGAIVNFLVKPLGVIKYYFSRDVADKLLNISFLIVEIVLIIWILRPPIMFQSDPITILLFFIACLLAVILNFAVGFIISTLSFWVENSWGPLFLLMILLEGLGGGLFPIDILPTNVYNFLMLTPFPYLLYFPAKIYIGGLPTTQIISGFVVLTFWVIIFWIMMRILLRKGLRRYTAVGN